MIVGKSGEKIHYNGEKFIKKIKFTANSQT